MKVLIVEDEENIARGIASILMSKEIYKMNIRFAKNGKDGLKLAEIFHPDLIITDVRMHMMNGLQLIECLKEKNIPAKTIIISGYDNFEYVQKALRLQAIDYILKPIDKSRLLELVDQVWKELPRNYGANGREICFDIDFFRSVDLDREEYPESLKKVIQYVQKHYMDDISVSSISEKMMLHPNYLSTILNRHLKINFSCLLDYVRLKTACELMITEQDMTVAELSYIVGYNNERRFYSAFSKRLGCTPNEFRKRYSVKEEKDE